MMRDQQDENAEVESHDLQPSCSGCTPISSRKQMSSSLRERLKRSSRYFTSPQSTLGRSAMFTSPCANTSPQLCQSTNEDFFALDLDSEESHHNNLQVRDQGNVLQLNVRKRPRPSENSVITNLTEETLDTSYLSVSAPNQKSCKSREPVPTSDVLDSPLSSIQQLKQARLELLERTARKEEMLRKLKLVKMYRAKNDLGQLQQLTEKWHQVCQVAVQDLWQLMIEPRPLIIDLLHHLQIDCEKVGYNPEDDSFS